MIKSLLEQDENQPDEIKSETKEAQSRAPDSAEIREMENPLEIADEATLDFSNNAEKPKSAFEKTFDELLSEAGSEPINFPEPTFDLPENSNADVISNPDTISEVADYQIPVETVNEKAETESPVESANETANSEPPADAAKREINFTMFGATSADEAKPKSDDLFARSSAEPESFAETARKSGLAYAAAITLFGAIVFMLIIGWFVDLLIGSSPWGIVSGIILGAAIGFFQFFRMTAQILKNKD